MCNCLECENLVDEYPLKVIDIPSMSFMDDEIYHFENGFKCTRTGNTAMTIEKLPIYGCRCTGGDE
jgi:hypothetical protein